MYSHVACTTAEKLKVAKGKKSRYHSVRYLYSRIETSCVSTFNSWILPIRFMSFESILVAPSPPISLGSAKSVRVISSDTQDFSNCEGVLPAEAIFTLLSASIARINFETKSKWRCKLWQSVVEKWDYWRCGASGMCDKSDGANCMCSYADTGWRPHALVGC